MTVVAIIGMPAEAFLLGRILENIDSYSVQLTQFIPTGDPFIPYLWIDSNAMDEIEPALKTHPRIASVERTDRRAGGTLCHIEWERPLDAFLQVLMMTDVLVSEARGTPDNWEFELVASDGDGLAEFQAACNDRNIPINIRQIFQSDPSSADRVELTDKQAELLRLAFQRGYFRVPREVSLTDIADELDISPQAASKRLRRALENVLRVILEDS